MRNFKGTKRIMHPKFESGKLIKLVDDTRQIILVKTQDLCPTFKTVGWGLKTDPPLLILAIDYFKPMSGYYLHALLSEQTVIWAFRSFEEFEKEFVIVG